MVAQEHYKKTLHVASRDTCFFHLRARPCPVLNRAYSMKMASIRTSEVLARGTAKPAQCGGLCGMHVLSPRGCNLWGMYVHDDTAVACETRYV